MAQKAAAVEATAAQTAEIGAQAWAISIDQDSVRVKASAAHLVAELVQAAHLVAELVQAAHLVAELVQADQAQRAARRATAAHLVAHLVDQVAPLVTVAGTARELL